MKKTFIFCFLITLLGSGLRAQQIDKSNVAVCTFWIFLDQNLGVNQNKSLFDSVYSTLTSTITRDAGYVFKDPSALRGHVAYTGMGYPMGGGKKAAKSNVAASYVKFQVQVTPQGLFTTKKNTITVNNLGGGEGKTKARIKIAIDATIFDAKGEKVKEVSESSVSVDEIEINQELVIIGTITGKTFNEQIGSNQKFNALLNEVCNKVAQAMK